MEQLLADLNGRVGATTGGLSATAGKLKVASTDLVSDYLNEKLIAGTGVTLTKSNTGGKGSEILTVAGHVAVTVPTNSGLSLSGQELTMGTPTTISSATTNSVTTDTHAHAVSLAVDDLSDVNITSIADTNVLKYDSASGTWKNAALPVDGGEPALGNPAVDDYVLSSKTDGTRSWVEQSGGTGGGADILQVQIFS
jgi:hypothetical protein